MPLFGRRKKKEHEPTLLDEGGIGSLSAKGEILPSLTSIDRGAVPAVDETVPVPVEAAGGPDGPGGGRGLLRALTRAGEGSRADSPYRGVRVRPGADGWGSGFVVEPQPGRDVVCSMTGGGIHPVAQRIAELSGAPVVDGFGSRIRFDELACAVIDCGGTARIGVYPMKGVLTIDIHPKGPSGPLADFITEENFVSGVTPDEVERAD